jgi:hypothetical protein
VADFEFACKAGTEAMFVALGLVESGHVEYAMGIGADTSQGAPNDALEFSASAGGAAYIFGQKTTSWPRWSRPTASPPTRRTSGAGRGVLPPARRPLHG